MPHPTKGGRYIRDPKTGTLVKADEKAPVIQSDIPSHMSERPELDTKPNTEVAPVATIKKGK